MALPTYQFITCLHASFGICKLTNKNININKTHCFYIEKAKVKQLQATQATQAAAIAAARAAAAAGAA